MQCLLTPSELMATVSFHLICVSNSMIVFTYYLSSSNKYVPELLLFLRVMMTGIRGTLWKKPKPSRLTWRDFTGRGITPLPICLTHYGADTNKFISFVTLISSLFAICRALPRMFAEMNCRWCSAVNHYNKNRDIKKSKSYPHLWHERTTPINDRLTATLILATW